MCVTYPDILQVVLGLRGEKRDAERTDDPEPVDPVKTDQGVQFAKTGIHGGNFPRFVDFSTF